VGGLLIRGPLLGRAQTAAMGVAAGAVAGPPIGALQAELRRHVPAPVLQVRPNEPEYTADHLSASIEALEVAAARYEAAAKEAKAKEAGEAAPRRPWWRLW